MEKSKKKQIFVVYNCDEYVSRDSERLVFISTSPFKIKRFIARQIEKGEYEYTRAPENSSRRRQAKQFLEDFETLTRNEMNGSLKYGQYDYFYDGEEI